MYTSISRNPLSFTIFSTKISNYRVFFRYPVHFLASTKVPIPTLVCLVLIPMQCAQIQSPCSQLESPIYISVNVPRQLCKIFGKSSICVEELVLHLNPLREEPAFLLGFVALTGMLQLIKMLESHLPSPLICYIVSTYCMPYTLVKTET